jgi:outer membrane protein assembly factor BamB
VARARTTSILAALFLASLAVDAQRVVPDVPAPVFPTSVIWTIEVSARPVGPPVSSSDRLFLALQSGVSALRLADGVEVWQAPLEVEGPMAASDERLVVAAKGDLYALDASTGAVRWTARAGPLTAPPVVHGEWLFVASAEHVTCYRLGDGTSVWSRETGAVEERPAVEGTRVYVATADGRVIALEIASGEPAWEFDIGINPTEPLVYDGRVFIGSAGKRLCSLFLESGRKKRDDWCYQVGAAVIGRPAADATHVYFVALDNLLRAHDRKNGAFRWKKDLRYRPAAGPLLVGTSVAVPGSVRAVPVFDARSGSKTIDLTLRAALATVPLLIEPASGNPARIAALAGELPRVWTVTLAGPAPPALPEIAVAPLTALPGLVIQIGAPPVLRERLPPAAAPLPRSDPASAPRTTAG